jgi:hypothetical protein
VADPIVPSDITLIEDAALEQLHQDLLARAEALRGEPQVTPELVQEAIQLQQNVEAVRAELAGRAVRRQQAAEAEARRLEQARKDALDGLLDGQPGSGDGEGGNPPTVTIKGDVDTEAIAAAAARGTVAALAAAGVRFPGARPPEQVGLQATTALAAAARTRPVSQLPERRLVVTAGVDIPGVATGGEMTTLEALADAVIRRAKAMPVSRDGEEARGPIVASIRNEFEHVVDDRHQPSEIEELLRQMRSEDAKEALLAGGGWCAPSEIRYDFFNVACTDGLIDLPTLGINRGGIRFPTSPSLADVFGAAFGGFSTTFSTTSNPFLWLESDDVATVTGAPNKPTVRVPCPSFNEVRLECYGLQVTAGNLTDDAYPEATRNFLRLMLAAHEHAMNGRLLALMVAQSSAAINTGQFAATGKPVFNQVIGGLGLAATDYRARYGMCEDDVLEVVGPKWVREAIRSDLAWRTGAGDELVAVTNAQIDGYLAARRVRVQWVDDWQIRASGLPGFSTPVTAWPTAADFLVYAAGTFVRGDGMTLDLGVVRDSVLNAENDYTAAFSEECHLIAKVGNESRRYTIAFNVNGATPPAVTLGANL